MDESNTYLRAILATVARQTFPVEKLYDLVVSNTGTAKQAEAYNLCDGTQSQAAIAATLSLDTGNFSKQLKRWMELGIVFKVSGPDGYGPFPLHVYSIPEAEIKARAKRNPK